MVVSFVKIKVSVIVIVIGLDFRKVDKIRRVWLRKGLELHGRWFLGFKSFLSANALSDGDLGVVISKTRLASPRPL